MLATFSSLNEVLPILGPWYRQTPNSMFNEDLIISSMLFKIRTVRGLIQFELEPYYFEIHTVWNRTVQGLPEIKKDLSCPDNSVVFGLS